MVLVTGTSLLVPLVGLATAPILSHSLGVVGRGEAGAAMAPNLLIVGGATLGLPAALTYVLARHPHLSRRAIGWASLFATVLGALTLVAVYFGRRYLSGGDGALEHLMLVGALFALPTLVVGLLRGAATGRQMWRGVALERAITTVLRLVLLAGAALLGRLDVLTAVVIMCAAPVASGLVYLGLVFRRSPAWEAEPDRVIAAEAVETQRRVARALLGFGSQVWLGSVAVMLMARLSQLMVTPLSGVEQLGLLVVAVTISDVPYLVTQTVREVTFGVNSAVSDIERLLATSRIATLVAVAGSLVLGGSLPLWIEFVFGRDFGGAVVPTWLLLVAACAAVPGLIAGAALDSAGRPGLRSLALGLALVANVVALLWLVPLLGAVGAALAALASTLTSTIFVVVVAARMHGLPGRRFVLPTGSDLLLLRVTATTVIRRVRPAPRAASEVSS